MGGTENVHPNLAKVPKCPAQDSAESWTDNLSQLQCFTFRTLYKHFAERTEFEVDDGECTDGAQADVESLVDDNDTRLAALLGTRCRLQPGNFDRSVAWTRVTVFQGWARSKDSSLHNFSLQW